MKVKELIKILNDLIGNEEIIIQTEDNTFKNIKVWVLKGKEIIIKGCDLNG